MINVLIMIAVLEEDRERFLSIPGYDCRFVRRKDVSEEDLAWAEAIIGQPDPLPFGDRVVGIVMDRHGHVLDQIRNIVD